jgi:hypothetical protein
LSYFPDWFKLADSSPAINKGQVIPEKEVDFYGVDRNALPDVGALEYNQVPGTTIFLPLI